MLEKPTPPYMMPAEWEPHVGTWLSWPHNIETWPRDGKYELMLPQYAYFVSRIAAYEEVHLNVNDTDSENFAKKTLLHCGVVLDNVFFHQFPTNDCWCRDHGPIFVTDAARKKIALKWEYNAWGGKYPPFDLDNQIPYLIADFRNVPLLECRMVLEGGSIEVNGKGSLITTSSCLLHKNRNPDYTKKQIEKQLELYLGAKNILWLHEGIVGDDTDGHIDDITRFVNPKTLVTVIEHDKNDENYQILKANLQLLQSMKDQEGNFFEIIELPMPCRLHTDGIRLPASYANFLIVNGAVLVPTFEDKQDDTALQILQKAFPDRKIEAIPAKHIVWGLGTLHCLSQQEPFI